MRLRSGQDKFCYFNCQRTCTLHVRSLSFNFRVNDPKSREYIKEQFGKNRKIEVYATTVQSKGMIEERRDGYVVEDWDVTNLKIGQAIIGLPEYEPFVFQFDLWVH